MVNIEYIIEQRLKMQSTQKYLKDKFSLSINNIGQLKESGIKNKYSTWSENKQSDFIKIIGGPRFFKITKNFILNEKTV